jgi:hypothetical protein
MKEVEPRWRNIVESEHGGAERKGRAIAEKNHQNIDQRCVVCSV